ncbi:CCR4-NOT transcription complex subunit 9-like isoform X3 [Macadamia integrifolia]|uniref:CCR4-NOT transcription complex subunit 9-like isoform X3 n=1 Tax=Macadamia integrifolia TaxID=60698 RepID=UPI001C5331F5|nr:CCR4-NOT transcription complex subunit 9-like isoform X3 [Macadamia integrifolia]
MSILPQSSLNPPSEGPSPTSASSGTNAERSTDAGVDASSDAGVDASSDAGVDASSDACIDASIEASIDAGIDASIYASIYPRVDANTAQASKYPKLVSAEQLVHDLFEKDLREDALQELCRKREIFQDLAPLLWHSFGTIAALLQEIVSIYPYLSPPTLTPGASNRVCNALALLQCVASHQDTRTLFLNAHIPLYLYPFLNTTSKTRPFEYLRLTSLGVIGALVKVDDTEVISFLLSTEIIPLCLRTMEMGSELSKTVATFIVQKILLDDVGLHYICATAERFFAVGRVLGTMVQSLAEQPSPRLLKHIIRCYLRLSDNLRACEALRNCLPEILKDSTFTGCLRDDPVTKRWLQQLVHNVAAVGGMPAHQPAGGIEHMHGSGGH